VKQGGAGGLEEREGARQGEGEGGPASVRALDEEDIECQIVWRRRAVMGSGGMPHPSMYL
jgi:hypothetical protein